MANEQFDPKKFKRETEETLSVVQDSLVSFAANLAAEMKKSVKAVADEADRTITKKVGRDFVKAFNSMAQEVKTMRANTDKFLKGQKTAAQLKRDRLRLEDKLAVLERARLEAEKHGYELGEERLEQINEYKAQLQEISEEQEKQNEQLNKRVLGLTGVMERLSKVPIAGELLNAADASEAMKEALLNGKTSVQAFGKGVSAAFKGISKATVILYLIEKTVDMFKFIAKMFVMNQESAVGLGQAMGTTVEQAAKLRDRFAELKDSSYQLNEVTQKNIQAIKDEFGQVSIESGDVIRNAAFLTQRLGMGAEQAAKLNFVFSSFGQDAENSTESINKLVQEFAQANTFAVPLDVVMKDLAETGDEMSGYFSFSAEALGEAALKTRQFGLALSQTKTVASGLLDFEKSLGAEMELRVLTGKNINLNAARLAALNGDTAEATKLVLEQMEKIPAAQRRSPVIMQQMAEAAGLTGDQLNRAFLLTQKTNDALAFQKDEYQRILDTRGKEAAEQFRQSTKLTQADIEAIKKRVPVTQQLSEALTSMQETIATLFPVDMVQKFVSAVDKMTVLFTNFILRANRVGFGKALLGFGDDAVFAQQLDAAKKSGEYTKEQLQALEEVQQTVNKQAGASLGLQSSSRALGGTYAAGGLLSSLFFEWLADKSAEEGIEMLNASKNNPKSGDYDDFTIRAHPKDTLVMAGGTKFGEETNTLLRELITAVKSGGHVYIDGRKVGESLVMSHTSTN